MKTQWIGPYDYENFAIGHRGFLVRHTHNLKGWVRFELRDTPPQTNMSHEDRLDGWCGTTNDVATYAEGAAEVIKIAKNGRLQVRPLSGDELTAFLDDMGYPDLGE